MKAPPLCTNTTLIPDGGVEDLLFEPHIEPIIPFQRDQNTPSEQFGARASFY